MVDTATQNAVKKIKVGRRPRGIVFLPDGSRAFVTNENDATLSVIDTAKLEVVGTIPTGEGTKPMGMALTKDGSKLYVSTGRGKSVVVIDTGGRKGRRARSKSASGRGGSRSRPTRSCCSPRTDRRTTSRSWT